MKTRIIAILQGGSVIDVKGLPAGFELAVHDYDKTAGAEDLETDEDGNKHHVFVYESEED